MKRKKVTEDEFEEIIDQKVIEFAREADDPKLWHQMAMTWNFDNGPFLHWLIDNPRTDKATALMIYWKTTPLYWAQYHNLEDAMQAGQGLEYYHMADKIERNYMGGFYQNSNIAFDPNSPDHDDIIWTGEHVDKEAVRQLHKDMYEKTTGETIEPPEDFEEGMPPELIEEIEKLYDQYNVVED